MSRRYRSKADDKSDIGKNDTVGRDEIPIDLIINFYGMRVR